MKSEEGITESLSDNFSHESVIQYKNEQKLTLQTLSVKQSLLNLVSNYMDIIDKMSAEIICNNFNELQSLRLALHNIEFQTDPILQKQQLNMAEEVLHLLRQLVTEEVAEFSYVSNISPGNIQKRK